MISLQDLKRSYVKLYSEVKNYIWPFDTVEHLADLEIAVFERFPDMNKVRQCFHTFRSDIYREIKEYEELEDAVNQFQTVIDSEDTIYSQLSAVTEEFPNESFEENKESSEGKRNHISSIRVSDRTK